MSLNISKSDRRLLGWSAAILLPIIVALALLASSQQDSGVPSTYSADSSGAKAAYLLLQELGYHVERWEESPNSLPAQAQHTVFVLAGPLNPPSQEEQAALKLYLSRGGRILATGHLIDLYLPEAKTVPEFAPTPLPQTYQPQLVSALTRAGQIRMSPVAYWQNCSTACLAHYSDSGRPIVVSYMVGKGELIWWASSVPLSNAGISRDGNLTLLLNSLGQPPNTRVFWDEYFHSLHRQAGSYIFERPVLFGLGQLAFLALALLLTYSRRNSPIYPSDEPSRLSPLEFVETVGGLYRRAHAVRAALEVPYHRFRTQAVRQLGLKNEISAADLGRALRNRLGYKNDDLEVLLQRIDAALYDPGLTEPEALELVQRLSVYARQFRPVSLDSEEIFSNAGSLAGADSRKS